MDNIEIIIRCPRCGQQTLWKNNENRPFCSERCQQHDLGLWANEEYAIPGKRIPAADDEEPEY